MVIYSPATTAFIDLCDKQFLAWANDDRTELRSFGELIADTLTDPAHAGIVRRFLAEVGLGPEYATCAYCGTVTADWSVDADEVRVCSDGHACRARVGEGGE